MGLPNKILEQPHFYLCLVLLRPIGEYVPRHAYGNGNHEAFEPDGREDIGTEEERGP